jgi:myo-inositol-1(or 4)-monophosphatase
MGEFQKECEEACRLASQVGLFIANEGRHFKQEAVEVKSFNQLVSYVDKTAEEKLVEGLGKIMPGAGFITEEETVASEEKEFMWVIDPLDGTTNFVHGIPVYSISIGLIQNRKPVMGVVHEVNREETFYAWKNSKAFMNGKEIRVKDNQEMSAALLATGFPYYDFGLMNTYLEALHILMKSTVGMRRMGSAAIDLAYVAWGKFDGFFEFGLNPWDVAGGVHIIRQAGGIVTDFSGTDDCIFGKEIIGATPGIYEAFYKIVNEKFKSS